MAQDLDWSPNFCLACDRQTDSGAYCTEGCRLAEYERANAGSEPSSPATHAARSPAHFHLPSAYDFTQRPRTRSQPAAAARPILTPSSSHSSLFSMQSSSSAASAASVASEQVQLSDEARRELRAYASAFDRSRCQRRQSAY